MKKSGFTLAEVLLTLAIIGVVAAMTVPSLMNSTEEKKLQSQAKKAYNTLQNALTMKQALTETTAADAETDVVAWLAGSGTDKVQVIKINECSTGASVVQLPDGQVMRSATNSAKNCTASAPCYITVDLNGAQGPTFSGAVAGSTTSGATISELVQKTAGSNARDIAVFQIQGIDVFPAANDVNAQKYINNRALVKTTANSKS